MASLGKKLKKIAKKVAPVINPVTYFTHKAGADVAAGKNPLKGLTDFGSQEGTPNPFSIPNPGILADTSKYDYLKNLSTGYKPVDRNEGLFNELLTSIGGQNQNDNEKLDLLLSDIANDERNTVGSTKLDFQERGLGGPGQISDIEAVALAQNRADANRTRAGARVEAAGKGLDRLASAYGTRYAAGNTAAATDAATQNDLLKTGNMAYADIANQREQLIQKLLADLYTGGESNRIATEQPGYLDNILRNIQLDIPIGGKK